MEHKDLPQDSTGLPPIFKNWNQMYVTLLAWQGFLIVLFYSFMQYFS